MHPKRAPQHTFLRDRSSKKLVPPTAQTGSTRWRAPYPTKGRHRLSEGLSSFLRHFRRRVGPCDVGEVTDRDLLHRFARGRDGVAFTVLVYRYGPLVLGVCRRVLRQEQDAENAFQATFL